MTRRSDVAPAIELRNIALRLGRAWPLRGVTLRVAQGELVAVLGHNGSGKTSLLRVIATALRATRGSGAVFGFDLVREANDVRAHCTMLAHGAGLYADLTAAENLEFAQRMMEGHADATAIAEALERVGLTHVDGQLLRTFSSGMQRRASLARLFLCRTPLLLLDEPYNSLDPDGRALVDELLLDVRARGGSALVVLHDLDQSGVDFGTTVEMHSGRIARVIRASERGPHLVVAGVGA